MLGYQHCYHAGNFADVVKHVVLTALMQAMQRKDTPMYIQDTHAGRGLYRLDSKESQQAREFENGIGRINSETQTPAAVHRYLDIVHSFNAGNSLNRYPGSPAIIRSMLRDDDRLILTELHPAEYPALAELFENDRRIKVHKQDAYQGLKSFLPPTQRRGLVLIDPPYERKDEYDRVVEGLKLASRRWGHGVYAIWYPVMSISLQKQFLDSLKQTGIRKMLHAGFMIEPFSRIGKKFVGCGVVLVNAPWQLDTELDQCLSWLGKKLAIGTAARYTIDWLVPE